MRSTTFRNRRLFARRASDVSVFPVRMIPEFYYLTKFFVSTIDPRPLLSCLALTVELTAALIQRRQPFHFNNWLTSTCLLLSSWTPRSPLKTGFAYPSTPYTHLNHLSMHICDIQSIQCNTFRLVVFYRNRPLCVYLLYIEKRCHWHPQISTLYCFWIEVDRIYG